MVSFESTWVEIESARPQGAVIGIGAIEQHGPHLPMNMDCMSAEYVARGIAQELDWYLLPTLPIGCSHEHLDFPGTLTLSSSTLRSVFKDILDSLRHHGISKLVIVSGHGGNWFLKMMTREINQLIPDTKVILVYTDRWFYPALTELTEDKSLHHAGEHETGVVMYLRPDLVKSPLPEDDNPSYGFDMLDLTSVRKLAPSGVWGFPSKASAEKGEKFLKRGLELALEYVKSRLTLLEELG